MVWGRRRGRARALRRDLRFLGPAEVIPPAFALSALIHGAEWICQTSWPRITSAAIYLHVAGFGAILLSGFWLLLSELFDPHEAKRRFGQVAGAGTAGGVAGGIAAERLVHWFGASALLLLLAGLHLLCAVLLHRLRPEGATPGQAARAPLRFRQKGSLGRDPAEEGPRWRPHVVRSS